MGFLPEEEQLLAIGIVSCSAYFSLPDTDGRGVLAKQI